MRLGAVNEFRAISEKWWWGSGLGFARLKTALPTIKIIFTAPGRRLFSRFAVIE